MDFPLDLFRRKTPKNAAVLAVFPVVSQDEAMILLDQKRSHVREGPAHRVRFLQRFSVYPDPPVRDGEGFPFQADDPLDVPPALILRSAQDHDVSPIQAGEIGADFIDQEIAARP